MHEYVVALDVEEVPRLSVGLILEKFEHSYMVKFVHLHDPISCLLDSVKIIDISRTGKKNGLNLTMASAMNVEEIVIAMSTKSAIDATY